MCPTSHPHPCKGGKMCSSSPWKPSSDSYADCDGDILKPTDNCCPLGQTKECGQNPSAICKKHPQFGKFISAAQEMVWEIAFSSLGVLCPSTHPYPCQKGAMCAKAPFKPFSGNASDCDGKRLSEDSVCCPADNVIPCSANSTIFRCKANPPGKSMFSYIQRWDLIFVHVLVTFLPALA